jgi:hypothetical protein
MASLLAIAVPLLALAGAAGLPGPAGAETGLLADRGAAIALLDLPCGEVLEAKPLAGNDHLVHCRDGHRYRVFINADGRLVVQPR